MTDKDLKTGLDKLLFELYNSHDKKIDKIVLAKAAQLGMKYQEEKIKPGIQIVFNELNK